MVNPWQMLTARGRAVLIGGLTCALLGSLLGQRDLIAIGAALFLVCIAAYFAALSSRPKMLVQRDVDPHVAALGSEITVVLDTEKKSSNLGFGVIFFSDMLPESVGSNPRFMLQPENRQKKRSLYYRATALQRGKHLIGPLVADIRDVLGLVRIVQIHTLRSDILITPKIWSLERNNLAGANGESGTASPQQLSFGGEDDILIREYRPGDDTRRIHWKSSARTGELMVRREEQVWNPAAIIICDTRSSQIQGVGMESSLEWIISAATSIALHFENLKYRVELVDANGKTTTNDESPLLVAAAEMEPAQTSSLYNALQAIHSSSKRTVVAVLAAPSLSDVEMLSNLKDLHSAGMAIFVDTNSFVDDDFPGDGDKTNVDADASAFLEVHGWHVVHAKKDTPLQHLWFSLTSGGSR